VIHLKQNEKYTYQDLLAIMEQLRGENGCPWDKEQTHTSIRRNFIEEVYEACEAIDESDMPLLQEELGDVLLQVVFHAQIAKENGVFDESDVVDGVCRKSLPALIRAEKVQHRAAKVGFDWDSLAPVLDKLSEEIDELRQAVAEPETLDSKAHIAEEIGDLLFAAVNVARHLGVSAEEALSAATEKFEKRVTAVAQKCDQHGLVMEQTPLAQLDKIWNEVKNENRRNINE
jgi:tetrapyrrole methylase family protein/MazG family protein